MIDYLRPFSRTDEEHTERYLPARRLRHFASPNKSDSGCCALQLCTSSAINDARASQK